MSTADRHAGRAKGGRRMEAAHDLLEAHRDARIRRARRALLARLLTAGTATADDVAEEVGLTAGGFDPRWRRTVPGTLARAGIIRDAGRSEGSSRPEARARRVIVWELADRAAALAWLAHNPALPEPEPGDGEDDGEPRPVPTSPRRPAPHSTTTSAFPTPSSADARGSNPDGRRPTPGD